MKRIVVLTTLVLTGLSSLATGQENRNQSKENMPKIPKDVSIEENVVFGKGGSRDLTMHVLSPKRTFARTGARVCLDSWRWLAGRQEGERYLFDGAIRPARIRERHH